MLVPKNWHPYFVELIKLYMLAYPAWSKRGGVKGSKMGLKVFAYLRGCLTGIFPTILIVVYRCFYGYTHNFLCSTRCRCQNLRNFFLSTRQGWTPHKGRTPLSKLYTSDFLFFRLYLKEHVQLYMYLPRNLNSHQKCPIPEGGPLCPMGTQLEANIPH